MTGSKSRRQQRREREKEIERTLMVGIDAPPDDTVKPAEVEGAPPLPDVITSLNQEIVRKRKHILPPPDQKELYRKSIVPRHQVDIIVESDPRFDEVEVRQSIIEDIDDQERLYLAQTSPPFLRSQEGRVIEPTFLSKYYDIPGGRWIRVGYRTPILEVIPDYKLSSEERIVVVVVDGPKELTPTTVRMSYRISPPEELDLRLVLWPQGTPVGLVDFSNGGLQFYHDKEMTFKKNQRLNLSLISGALTLLLPSRVVRSVIGQDLKGRDIGMTSVVFHDIDPRTRVKYQQLLNSTYRYLLAQRSGIKPPE